MKQKLGNEALLWMGMGHLKGIREGGVYSDMFYVFFFWDGMGRDENVLFKLSWNC